MVNIGFIYDFDLTLTEEFMQMPIFRAFADRLNLVYGITDLADYWRLSDEDDCNLDIGYMQQMIEDTPAVFWGLTNEEMQKKYGPQIKLAPGIPEWFSVIDQCVREKGFEPQHHVISSGIKHLIDGSEVAPYVDSVEAGEFLDDGENLSRIRKSVHPFLKVALLKEICKGGDLLEDQTREQYNVNYEHVFVFGDGQSDRNMFRFIREAGGIAVAVYEQGNQKSFEETREKLSGDVNLIVPRDYRDNSILIQEVRNSLNDMALVAAGECDMDFSLVYRANLGQIKSPEVKVLMGKHQSDCELCQRRLETRTYFG